MAFILFKHKWHKTTAYVSAIVVAVIMVLAFLINAYWSPILSSKIKDVVLSSTDSLYNVDFSSAEFHVIRGSIILNNVTLKVDTCGL